MLKIYPSLIEAKTNLNIWAESYEQELGNFLKLLNSITKAIATNVQVKLTSQ